MTSDERGGGDAGRSCDSGARPGDDVDLPCVSLLGGGAVQVWTHSRVLTGCLIYRRIIVAQCWEI